MPHDRNLRRRGSVRCRGLAAAVLAAVVVGGITVGAGVAGADTAIPRTPGVDGAVADAIERVADPVPGQYVVTLQDTDSTAGVSAQAVAIADEYDGTVLDTYGAALSGFSIRMSEADAEALARDPAVASVTQDGFVHVDETESPAPWGLDRLDQRTLPLDNSFVYRSDGSATTVYIIDSGIRTSHSEFEGRARVGIDLVGDGYNGQDCLGHGTHVASTIGGRHFGVAKNASLVSVRALNCQGSAPYSRIIAAVDWVTAHHESPAVANMSLTGTEYAPLDLAVGNSIQSGVTYVVAAGNNSASACGFSPADAPNAITVGATNRSDVRPSFSNFGPCVDVFGPGVDIEGAGISSDTATAVKSGTSMSSPYVAGLAAAYLNEDRDATPAQVRTAIVSNATSGQITNAGANSPNLLAYTGFIDAPVPGPPVPVTRIAGPDAVGTSLAISQATYADGAASAVVLARSDFFADALAGGPLAAARAAPLLITPGAAIRSDIDPRVLDEITRVLPGGRTVYVLGGSLALAPDIDAALEAAGYAVVRVQGANQFATAVEIADELGNPSVVFEATGLDFADALSAVPAAIQARGAILLTRGRQQAPETAAYLATHAPATRYAIGGPLAAAGADPSATPVYGEDLFATSAAVATTFFPTATSMGAATGFDFPDALSGGVFMGASPHVGPMLLVTPSSPIPDPIVRYLDRRDDTVMSYLFGGPLAVGDDVAEELGAH